MSHTHTTQAQAKTQLAARLGDPNKVFWTDSELGLYLQEAQREWGSHTHSWRAQELLPSSSGQSYYNLSSLGIRSHSITDQTLATFIEYHLMEPPTPSSWTGSELYTLTELQQALQNRLNRFVAEVELGVGASDVFVPSLTETLDLADSVLDIRRVWWRSISGTRTPLFRADERELQYLSPTWRQTLATPTSWSQSAVPPLTVRLSPIPVDGGYVEYISLSTGTALNLASGVTIAVPDDLASTIKWGALADLLGKDGEARDPVRALYCEERWRRGLELAKMYPGVLEVRVADALVPILSLFELETMVPNWRSSSGTPQYAIALGGEAIGFYPVPSSTDASLITVTAVRKAPVTAADGDYIQVGRDQLNILLDYAAHLASFKLGGLEFIETQKLYDNFVKAASLANEKLAILSRQWEPMAKQKSREEVQRPLQEVTDGVSEKAT